MSEEEKAEAFYALTGKYISACETLGVYPFIGLVGKDEESLLFTVTKNLLFPTELAMAFLAKLGIGVKGRTDEINISDMEDGEYDN